MRYPDEVKRAAVERYAAGDEHVDDIATDVGCHPDTLRSWARKAGVERRSRQQLRGAAAQAEAPADQRTAEAVRLRIAGASLSQIARTLDYYDASGASKAVNRGLQALRTEGAAELRDIELVRCDEMTRVLWTIAADPEREDRDRVRSINAITRVMERRARLAGLDSPELHEVSGPGGGPIPVDPEAVLGMVERQIDELSERRSAHNGQRKK